MGPLYFARLTRIDLLYKKIIINIIEIYRIAKCKAKIYQVAQTPTVEDIIESACGEGAKKVIQGDLVVGWFGI